jgi:transcriptional regulator with XRE-family HTH domain
MLPFCDRTISIARKDVAPVWTRSFPVSKQPKSIGEHLRKRRFRIGIRQSEAAQRLGISERTLSLWECDEVYPAWPQQPALIDYLGYDPFVNPELGRPKGNETPVVAILAPNGSLTIGQQIRKLRMESRKTLTGCAKELNVSIKTMRDWETGRRKPSSRLLKQITAFLQCGPNPERFTADS